MLTSTFVGRQPGSWYRPGSPKQTCQNVYNNINDSRQSCLDIALLQQQRGKAKWR